jgi:hypothetical protein
MDSDIIGPHLQKKGNSHMTTYISLGKRIEEIKAIAKQSLLQLGVEASQADSKLDEIERCVSGARLGKPLIGHLTEFKRNVYFLIGGELRRYDLEVGFFKEPKKLFKLTPKAGCLL